MSTLELDSSQIEIILLDLDSPDFTVIFDI